MPENGVSTREEYQEAVHAMDVAVCEAVAVSQAQVGRLPAPCIGYASYVYARLCAHGVAAMRAVPLSRWVNSDSEEWGFSVLAGHARAILEGYLYFVYLTQPTDEAVEEGRAKITLLQLNDCCSRLKLFETSPEQVAHFEQQAEELRDRLRTIPYFQNLPAAVQNTCLAGKKAWFMDRAQLVALVGMEKPAFDILWDLWSQHTHIHPMSFYRMEPNGRGSGLECDPDRLYLWQALMICAGFLEDATNTMVEHNPDVAQVRQGIDSKFSPGPARNLP